jgi:hypothetical protein
MPQQGRVAHAAGEAQYTAHASMNLRRFENGTRFATPVPIVGMVGA